MRRAATIAAAAVLAALGAGASAQTLRIGLGEDPDMLDPTLARTFVGRIVFAGLCDKLFDISPDLKIVPQLASSYSWSDDKKSLEIKLRPNVLFHDGEKLDAEAVKFNIERHLKMPGSVRKAEIAAVQEVEIVDPATVRLNLSSTFAPLLAQLTDRAGMMVSPKAAQAAGDKFAQSPVCAGPYKFAERVAQDRIVLERFDKYWNKDHYKFEKVVYQPIPDAAVRLANLQSGGLDFIERVAPTDYTKLKQGGQLKTAEITELGYQSINVNVGNGVKGQGPLAKHPQLREALDLAIDRAALNQVVFEGLYELGNQWV